MHACILVLGLGHVQVLVAEHLDLDLQRFAQVFESRSILGHSLEHIANAAHNIEDQKSEQKDKKRSYL